MCRPATPPNRHTRNPHTHGVESCPDAAAAVHGIPLSPVDEVIVSADPCDKIEFRRAGECGVSEHNHQPTIRGVSEVVPIAGDTGSRLPAFRPRLTFVGAGDDHCVVRPRLFTHHRCDLFSVRRADHTGLVRQCVFVLGD